MDVTSGGLDARQKIPLAAGYQVPFAEKVKKESGITTMTVGLIAGYQQAEDIVASGKADMVCLARGAMWYPRWAWHAAEELGAEAVVGERRQRGHDLEIAEPRAVVALDAPQRDDRRCRNAGRCGSKNRRAAGTARVPRIIARRQGHGGIQPKSGAGRSTCPPDDPFHALRLQPLPRGILPGSSGDVDELSYRH